MKAHLVDGTYELFRHHFGMPEEARTKPGTNGAARGCNSVLCHHLRRHLTNGIAFSCFVHDPAMYGAQP